MTDITTTNKAVVTRLVHDVLNGGRLDIIDQLYAPELVPAARRWIAPFRESFPDVHMDIVDSSPKTTKSSAGSPAPAPTPDPGKDTHPPTAASPGSPRSTSSPSTTTRSPTPGAWKTPTAA
jgi:hypothetical protein